MLDSDPMSNNVVDTKFVVWQDGFAVMVRFAVTLYQLIYNKSDAALSSNRTVSQQFSSRNTMN